jgi:L-threonylcarbamoyladenylate synthase
MHSNPAAPGQLDQHYSPGCELLSVDADHIAKTMDSLLSEASSAKTGFLWPSKSCSNAFLSKLNCDLETRFHQLTHYHLSDVGDDKQAAMNLFGLLRQFDKDGCSRVYFTWFPTAGLGRAINDRLQRASTKTKG